MKIYNYKLKTAVLGTCLALALLSGCTTTQDPSVSKEVVKVEQKEGDPKVEVSRDTRVTTNTQTEVVPAEPVVNERTTSTTTEVQVDAAQPEPQKMEVKTDTSESSESSMSEPKSTETQTELAMVTFSENGGDVSQTLAKQAVVVSSSNSTYSLGGEVTDLSITGNDNVVMVDSADSIKVSGDKNRVKYGGTTPIVSDTGTGNLFEEKK